MRNIWLIARREYLERVRTRSFMVMTVLIPLLMIFGVVASAVYSHKQSSEAVLDIVATDSYTDFALALQTDLREHSKKPRIVVDVISPPDQSTQQTLNEDLKDENINAYLWIEQQPDGTSRMRWVGPSATDELKASVFAGVDRVAVFEKMNLNSRQIEIPADASSQDGSVKVTAMAFFFMMYFVIMMYGMNVSRSIIEEKTSRVFEVLLATIRPEEMMAGKVIGVGAVGLTQVTLWVIVGLVLSMVSSLGQLAGFSIHIHLGVLQLLSFIGFFLLGYLLYSAIAAALGAMTNSEQELQQMNMFLALPLALNLPVMGLILSNPQGLLATVGSFIPFCTPLTMYLRVAIGGVPAWQVALSVFDLLLCAWFFLWVASRIYRVGILMYGKKPSLSELLRWLKYS